MKPKKADLSITVIITAVIGLVALVVIIAIFTNTTQKTAKNIGSCTAKGGTCLLVDDCPSPYPIRILVSGDCENRAKERNNVCCFPAK